jgi:hypothetical protein
MPSGKTLFLSLLFTLALFYGCSGKIAKTGCATVRNVSCEGILALQYADGKMKLKQLEQANFPSDLKKVKKNLLRPAKYVETVKGGTLTFPNGDTIICHDVKRDKDS